MKPGATVVIIATLVLLAGLYFVLRGTGRPTVGYEPQSLTYRLVVGQQRVIEGPTVLNATQGDSVTLVVAANTTGTLHLHGYEKLLPITPGSDTSLTFTASRAGWYPVGLHNADGTESELAAIQVQPRP